MDRCSSDLCIRWHDALIAQYPISARAQAHKIVENAFANKLRIADAEVTIPFSGNYGRSWGETRWKDNLFTMIKKINLQQGFYCAHCGARTNWVNEHQILIPYADRRKIVKQICRARFEELLEKKEEPQ